jgi:hypothetical protein
MSALTKKLKAAGFSEASGQLPNLNIVKTQSAPISNFFSKNYDRHMTGPGIHRVSYQWVLGPILPIASRWC